MIIRSIAAAICAAWAGAAASSAPPSAVAAQCFDALIAARITAQVPSDFPDAEDGYIIMSWPYFIDLDVKQVIKGSLPGKKITALSVQHSYWKTNLGKRKWWVRRNSEGGYNLLQVEPGREPPLCPPNTLPAQAYLQPADGETLEDLRRKGELRYRRRQ